MFGYNLPRAMELLQKIYPNNYPILPPQILENNINQTKKREIGQLMGILQYSTQDIDFARDISNILQYNFSPKLNGFKISTTPWKYKNKQV